MKTKTIMKTTILAMVLIMGTLFTSCDSDDPPVDPIVEDPIVGVWKLTAVYVDGELDEQDTCDLKALFTFAKDGTYSAEDYKIAADETTCELVGTDTTTWLKNSDGTYTVGDEGGSITITFSNNNDTWETSISEGEGEEKEITKYVYTRQ